MIDWETIIEREQERQAYRASHDENQCGGAPECQLAPVATLAINGQAIPVCLVHYPYPDDPDEPVLVVLIGRFM